MKKSFLLTCLQCLLLGIYPLISQAQQRAVLRPDSFATVIEDLQRGITNSDINAFAKHFGKQVYVDLPGEDGGYFSENQLFYILQNFFGPRHAQQFKFSTVDESDSGSYATGSCVFLFRGHREMLQIYVALSKLNDKLVITQFNVY